MSTRSRQRDAMEYVKQSLAEKNCAISHRDDLFGDEETEAWDKAEAFMEKFARSEEALNFEKSHHQLIQDNLALDARESQTVKDALEKSESATRAYEAATKEFDEAGRLYASERTPGAKKRLSEAKANVGPAMLAWKEAKGRHYTLTKEFADERKTLNKLFKPYVFHGTAYLGRAVNYADAPILLTADHRFLEIANDYYNEQAKVRIATIWRVSPIPRGVPLPLRKGSQLWHRDQTDGKILKLFIYFTDVDEGTGALEYIPDSLPQNSRWSQDIPLLEHTGYPPQELVTGQVPPEGVVKCVGKKGTLAFVDTAGLHRGGYATTGPRVTVQSTYLRQTPKYPQQPLMMPGDSAAGLSPEQVFAFS